MGQLWSHEQEEKEVRQIYHIPIINERAAFNYSRSLESAIIKVRNKEE